MNERKIGEPEIPCRLLVVDDEEYICEFVEFVAKGLGYQVTRTNHAKEVLALYSDDFSVIVLDLAMPEMDGVELLRFFAEKQSQAAVILMSGFDQHVLGSARSLASTRGLNVVGSLNKPIAISDLEGLLSNVPESKPNRMAGQRPEQQLSVDELLDAIRCKQLTVFYQPRIHLAKREFVGVEALVRWRHPSRGLVSPGLFIPMAEENGLIDDLTTIVMDESLEQLRQWSWSGRPLKLSVNMSARTLTNLEFPDFLAWTVKTKGLNPSQIIIEVTESSVVNHFDRPLDILTRLRMKGFTLAIDDFGTGYSSMQQLQRLPFNELKIDQSFVFHTDTDKESQAIVEATIDLGRKLKMNIVAEGIESKAVWDFLNDRGCDEAQGYFMGKPMPASELAAWQRNWR